MAPPCGTAARCREIPVPLRLQSQGAPNPKPLRSEAFPRGLSGLSPLNQKKVQAANAIYDLCAWVVEYCIQNSILWSVENPERSLLWWIPPWPAICGDPETDINDFRSCMLGGSRDKRCRWISSKLLFRQLRLECDGLHSHRPWGFVEAEGQFATADEAAYPDILCTTAAQLVHSRCIADGCVAVPQSLESGALSELQILQLKRASVGKQPKGRTLPQLMPEFLFTSESQVPPLGKNQRLLRQYVRMGEGGPQKVFVSGTFREPADFFSEATSLKHPLDLLCFVPDITRKAIFRVLTRGPVQISKDRILEIRRLQARISDLSQDVASLHAALHDRIRPVLVGKRLLLFKRVTFRDGVRRHLALRRHHQRIQAYRDYRVFTRVAKAFQTGHNHGGTAEGRQFLV